MGKLQMMEGQEPLLVIKQLVSEGVSSAEIGRRLTPTISREGIRQIIEKYGIRDTFRENCITASEHAVIWGLPVSTVWHRISVGTLLATKRGKKWFIPKGERKRCLRCKELLPEEAQRRHTYTCDNCKRLAKKKIGWRYLRRRMGKPIVPSSSYTHPKRSPILRKQQEASGEGLGPGKG